MSFTSKKYIIKLCVFFASCLVILSVIAIKPPKSFPNDQFDINIPQNSSLTFVSNYLNEKHVISSPFLFKVITVILGGRKGVHAGDYRFNDAQNLIVVASRIVNGDQQLPKIKITIPEGTNVADMAFIFLSKLSNFNAPKFVLLARSDEGYLFPDTYYFLSNTKPEEVIKEMKANFNKKIAGIDQDIKKSTKSLKDIITMASIIEEEARGFEDKKMVSGILWHRINEGMLLQVDPPFYFITGKTGTVTYDDLKVESPYNTYKYKGLPKGPISNPGIESIKAALSPATTDYLFYLTGKDGVMRYSKTYDGHIRNKNIYLD